MSALPPGVDPPLRAIVVDDEPLAREGLVESIRRLVARRAVGPIEIVAACASGVSGQEAIRRLEPDIALVDIAMPQLNGLDMLEGLEPEITPPAVILVTAYEQHALRAFGVSALDYLVKPVPESRLRDALLRATMRVAEVRALRASLEAPITIPAETAGPPFLRQLTIPERGLQLVIPVDEIEWIEGETYYVRVHANGGSRLLRERLGALERALDPSRFYRTHRSALIRVELLREIRAESPYSSSVLLATGARVPLSKGRQRGLEELVRGPL